MARKVLGSGAEATIYLDEEKGAKRVIKERAPKAYRLSQLDEELRKTRTRKEASILRKLPIPGPRLFESDDRSRIAMEFIEGTQVKRLLDQDASIARTIGERVAQLHDAGIIHGDLTTSNMIMREKELLFIDFGLSFTSKEVEDKAVDLHLFRQALESKHFRVQERAYGEFLKGYGTSRHASEVLERLKLVERRGRNKAKY
jgi:Kae1-associated kinase Bud32